MTVLPEAVIPDVIRVCTRIAGRNKEQSCLGRDDMVSVALEKLVRSSHIFEKGDMGLVAVIAQTAIVDELRRLRYVARYRNADGKYLSRSGPEYKVHSYDEEFSSDNPSTVKDLIQHEDDLSEIDYILELMPPREQFIVVAYMEGYSQKEIGEFLGITESRVSQLLELARSRVALAEAYEAAGRNTSGLRRWPVERGHRNR